MANQPRTPLSDEETAYLVQLANGNAIAKQRRRDKKRSRSLRSPSPGE